MLSLETKKCYTTLLLLFTPKLESEKEKKNPAECAEDKTLSIIYKSSESQILWSLVQALSSVHKN